jgi:hypothetical protein
MMVVSETWRIVLIAESGYQVPPREQWMLASRQDEPAVGSLHSPDW